MGEPEGEFFELNTSVVTGASEGLRGCVHVPFQGFVTANQPPAHEDPMKKTKPRTHRYHRLASLYRPRAPRPFEQVIRVLVTRQEKINFLVRSGRRVPSKLVSVTIDGLVKYTGLSPKQVRDALETPCWLISGPWTALRRAPTRPRGPEPPARMRRPVSRASPPGRARSRS